LTPEPEPEPSSSKRTLREAAAQTIPLEINAEASSSKDKLRSASAASSVNGTAAGKRKDLDSPSPSDEALGRGEKRARREQSKNDSLENGKGVGQEADTSSKTLKDKLAPDGGLSREGTETPEPSSTAGALNKKKKKQLGGEKSAGKNPNRPQASSALAPIKGKEPGLLRYPKQDEDGKHFESSKVQFLFGHSGEVFVSAWNPTVPDLVASGAGDATVRIWDLNSGDPKKDESGKAAFEAGEPLAEALVTKTVCKHLPSTHAKDVSALDWNPDGTLLASGSYDGILRLWTPQGDLHLVMSMHQGPIFSVRWNRKGTQLLTGSADSTAIVWDLSSGKVRQQYALHSDSVLDVDWLSAPKASTSKNAVGSDVPAATLAVQDTIFATCSADNSINLLKLGESKPLRMFKGHSDEVNAIAFDNSRTLLASASDDMTAKIWALDSAKVGLGASAPRRSTSPSSSRKRNSPDYAAGPRKSNAMDVDAPVDDGRAAAGEGSDVDSLVQSKLSKGLKFTLAGHTRELYALAWCPSGPGTSNGSEPRMLATSAFDHTARLWNADDGSCLRIISNHSDSVYSLAFSPDAQYLVTGGIDALVLITRLNVSKS
jgi:transducin (beta)-like 1